MSRKKKEDVNQEESLETTSEPVVTGTPEVSEPTSSAPDKIVFDVYNVQGTLVRTYSVEQHGENAENLAHEYASKIGGQVL